MTRRIRRLLAAALIAAMPTLAGALPSFATVTTVTLDGQVPITCPSGYSCPPLYFGNDGTANWPRVQLFDGANLGVINPNGQQTPNNSAPVVLPQVQVTTDPCTLGGGSAGPVFKVTVAFSTAAGTLRLVAPVAVEQVYICAIDVNTTVADSISLIAGTGATCDKGSPVAIVGSTTASAGMSFPANYTWSRGDGAASVYRTTTAGQGVCLLQSGRTALSGAITYVQQL
jgi:hypothetical protein